jgi:hypothetical protein
MERALSSTAKNLLFFSTTTEELHGTSSNGKRRRETYGSQRRRSRTRRCYNRIGIESSPTCEKGVEKMMKHKVLSLWCVIKLCTDRTKREGERNHRQLLKTPKKINGPCCYAGAQQGPT